MDYEIGCMNLAATNLERMVEFYTHVFGIEFTEHALQDAKLYEGEFAGTGFVLLPAALAGVTAAQNRMQFDIFVPDIQRVIDAATNHGGKTNGQLREDDEVRCIGIHDPDENFLVFKQRK